MLKNSIILLVVAAACFGGWVIFTNPKSYEECMLNEMRGQQPSMYGTAQAACERRFNRETEITLAGGDWSWSNSGGLHAVRFGPSVLRDYRIVRGRFSFSNKQCSDSRPSDFELDDWRAAVNDEFFFSGNTSAVCVKVSSLIGTWR